MLFVAGILFFLVFFFIHYLRTHDRGSKEPVTALWAAVGFGALAVLIASIFNAFIPSGLLPDILAEDAETLPLINIAVGSLMIGIIEETAKFLPLALFIRKKHYFNEITDGVIYFGIAAMTFGAIEDLLYAAEFGFGTLIMRLVIGPFLHVGFTIFVGLAFARHIVLKASLKGVVGALLIAILLHGFYDFALFSGQIILIISALVLSVILNIYVFKFFRKAQKHDERLGKSTVGKNNYCRACGAKNLNRTLYCENCGRYT